jgi:hypothetical protein
MKINKLLSYTALVCMLFGLSNIKAQCFTPLYPSGNLVSDPECTSLSTYAGWGNRTVITDLAKVYCGTSCIGVTGACGGSIDYPLTGKLTANTTYRLKAMVYSNNEVFLNLNGCGINGTTATYQKVVNTGSTWKAVDFIFVTGTLGASQDFWFNSCSGGNKATDMRLDNFEIYKYTEPTLIASTPFLPVEGAYFTNSFTVTGANQSAPVTLTAPVGITLSTYSIPANPTAVSVNVTYNGTTSVADTIRLTSGTATAKIAVKSYSSACFTAIYPTGNMIADPLFCAATLAAGGFGGWGKAGISYTNPYCGRGSAYVCGTGWPNGGSIDRFLTTANGNALKPLSTYRLRAMVNSKASGATYFHFQIEGVNGAANQYFNIPNTSGWKQIDTIFTTGATVSEHGIYFNSATSASPALTDTCFIDNYEMYAIPTWNGTGNWSTSANWGGAVPSTGADIVVMSGTLTIDQSISVGNLTVYPGAKVTLNSGNTLTVTGNLTIQSNATGTGTFVDLNPTGGLTVSGTTRVQQYLPSGRNSYISSPVTGATTAVLNTATSVVSYDEVHGTSAPWVTESGSLTPLKGYISVNTTTSGVVTFSGTLNTGTKTIAPTRTAGQAKEGFNLVGNPYPSYVSWTDATKTNLLTTMWYRTKSASAYVFDTYNSTGGIGTSNGLTTVSNLIPPMQGFWVRVDVGQTSGTLGFTNAMRSHADVSTNSFKAPSATKVAQQVLRLQVSNGSNSDEAVVYLDPNASNGYDVYDSPKMTNANAAIPEIYTIAGTEQLVINGLNNVTANAELPLGFTTSQPDSFSIRATQFSGFDATPNVYLRDNVLNTEQNLTDGTAYSFSSDIATTSTRFNLIFKSPSVTTGLNDTTGKQVVLIYKNANNQITVNCKGNVSGDAIVSVYNALGQKMQTEKITSSNTVLGMTFTQGVYVVNVNNGGKYTTAKVILN